MKISEKGEKKAESKKIHLSFPFFAHFFNLLVKGGRCFLKDENKITKQKSCGLSYASLNKTEGTTLKFSTIFLLVDLAHSVVAYLLGTVILVV